MFSSFCLLAFLQASFAARIEHLGNASTFLCPAGASASSGRWRDYGWGLTGYHWRFMVCEQCTVKASSSLKPCGSRGSRVDGGYTYGDEGACRSKIGCKCRESRQAGNANSGFTMVQQCQQTSFKIWQKCCDSSASQCCDGTSCELTCPKTSWFSK